MAGRFSMILAGAGSAALLLGALGFQYLGGLAPCPLCIWQRWPHGVAIALAVLGVTLLWPLRRAIAALGALAMLAGAGIAVFHTGVERGWWEGLDTCSAPDIGGLSADALLDQIMNAPLVRCDEVPWEFLTLSMATWNALMSLGLAALWFWAAITPAGRSRGPSKPNQDSSSASQ